MPKILSNMVMVSSGVAEAKAVPTAQNRSKGLRQACLTARNSRPDAWVRQEFAAALAGGRRARRTMSIPPPNGTRLAPLLSRWRDRQNIVSGYDAYGQPAYSPPRHRPAA